MNTISKRYTLRPVGDYTILDGKCYELVTQEQQVLTRSIRDLTSAEQFYKFCQSCVCKGGKAVGAEATYMEFWRAYGFWYSDVGRGAKKMSQQDFEYLAVARFWLSEGTRKSYKDIKVFMSAEDALEFDIEG